MFLDKEYSGIFKLAGLNCKKYKDLSEDTDITSNYKVKSFPKIMAIGINKKTKFYEGEIKQRNIIANALFTETHFSESEKINSKRGTKEAFDDQKILLKYQKE